VTVGLNRRRKDSLHQTLVHVSLLAYLPFWGEASSQAQTGIRIIPMSSLYKKGEDETIGSLGWGEIRRRRREGEGMQEGMSLGVAGSRVDDDGLGGGWGLGLGGGPAWCRERLNYVV
jgi:hypothetical protein